MEPIIISASFFQEQLYLGVLGRTGEHEARRISFDCSEVLKTWPEATILCVCRRPCDTAAYPISLTADGTTYTMPLMSRETAAAGTIKLELRAVRDDTVLKSAIFYGRILPSLNGQKDAPGNPLSDALNRLESTIANAQTLADEIRQKLDNGEFVGERGPQGEPGKDGSDATVTAENIQSALGYAPVKDVQVNGTSILTSGVANIPKAELEKLGLVACGQPWSGGLYINPDGIMRIVQAPPTDIDARENATRPITGNNLDYAVKAAMCDGKGAAWTSAEQKAARERMGIPGGYELIEEITIAEGNVSIITRDVDRLCSAKLVIICPPMENIITANALIYFGDASKPEYIYLFSEIAPSDVGVYRHTTLEAELRNNYWRSYRTSENDDATMYPNGSWVTHISETAPSRLMQLPSSNLDAITKITLSAYPTGTYIPVGTKISIYGARA